MIKLFVAFLFCFFTFLSMSQELTLSQLSGQWFIHESNFPMWTKGKKTNPTFNYEKAMRGQKWVLLDEVRYVKNGKGKSIKGIDKPVNEANTQFVWRGTGILKSLKSKWEILYFEDDYMIIHFKRTLFTPEGYDVVSKLKVLYPQLQENIDLKLAELGIDGLMKIKQE